jgi:hypothetical protein
MRITHKDMYFIILVYVLNCSSGESWQEASAVRVVSSLVSRLITAITSSPRGLTFFAAHHRHSTALIKALLRVS